MACPRIQKMPEKANIGGLQVFDYAGMQVIHQFVDRDYVHIRLHFDWANRLEFSKASQLLAVESAFSAGAGKYNPSEYAEKVESVGAMLDFQSDAFGPVLRLNCLPDRLPQAFELLLLALTEPNFDRDAFLGIRDARVAALRAKAAERKVLSMKLVQQATLPASMQADLDADLETEKVSRTIAEDLFKNVLRRRCGLRWIISGPIDAEVISDMLLDPSDLLPVGNCERLQMPIAEMNWSQIKMEQARRGLGVATALLPAPEADAQAAWPMRMLAEILRQRMQAALVENDRIAESVDCYYLAEKPAFVVMQISAKNAFQGTEFALSEIRKAKENGFQLAEVEAAKEVLRTQLALSYEAAPALSSQLDAAASLGMPNLAGNEEILIEKANQKTMQSLLKQYFHSISWGLVGDTTKVDRKSMLKL